MAADFEREDGKSSTKAIRHGNNTNLEVYNATIDKVGKRSSLFSHKMRKFETQNSRKHGVDSDLGESMRKYETQITRKSEKKKSEKYEKLIESNYFD